MRTPEQLAPAAIAELLPKLTRLTTDQPTTAELEEALLASKAITRATFEWLAARYCAQSASKKAYGIPSETPAEREELDRIEQARPIVLGLPA
jgi:hypothetical protein